MMIQIRSDPKCHVTRWQFAGSAVISMVKKSHMLDNGGSMMTQ